MILLCLLHRLRYNSVTNQYGNTPGVETNVPGFGNTSSIEYLDPALPWFEPTQYFHAMVQHFVQLGYEPGKNIRGAPFDWRYSAGVHACVCVGRDCLYSLVFPCIPPSFLCTLVFSLYNSFHSNKWGKVENVILLGIGLHCSHEGTVA